MGYTIQYWIVSFAQNYHRISALLCVRISKIVLLFHSIVFIIEILCLQAHQRRQQLLLKLVEGNIGMRALDLVYDCVSKTYNKLNRSKFTSALTGYLIQQFEWSVLADSIQYSWHAATEELLKPFVDDIEPILRDGLIIKPQIDSKNTNVYMRFFWSLVWSHVIIVAFHLRFVSFLFACGLYKRNIFVMLM